MRVLESSIQRQVVPYARKRGAVAIKLTTAGIHGAAGWPDYLFICQGKALFVEFKGPKGKITPLQAMRHRQLEEQQFPVFVVNNVIDGKNLLDTYFRW